MSNQFGLRNLLLITAGAAGCMMLVIYAIRNHGDYAAIALVTCLAMVILPFLLFGIAFAILLPLGVIDAMARESAAPAASPFATDRLPDQQVLPSNHEPSH
ncbi:MAG: hypothetical protein MUF23_02940 [Pirellula sp.]|jgi:hypothetical protein|nr:hypothetical protein [Pirellula sp.]